MEHRTIAQWTKLMWRIKSHVRWSQIWDKIERIMIADDSLFTILLNVIKITVVFFTTGTMNWDFHFGGLGSTPPGALSAILCKGKPSYLTENAWNLIRNLKRTARYKIWEYKLLRRRVNSLEVFISYARRTGRLSLVLRLLRRLSWNPPPPHLGFKNRFNWIAIKFR